MKIIGTEYAFTSPWPLFHRIVDVGFDLGSVNTVTVLHSDDAGDIFPTMPSAVASNKDDGDRVIAVGEEAARMEGRTSKGIEVTWPIRDGVIFDLPKAGRLLTTSINRLRKHAYSTVIIGVPFGTKPADCDQLIRAALKATRAKRIFIVNQTMLAAIGAGIDVCAPNASLVIDIGGETACVGLISLCKITSGGSTLTAGNAIDTIIGRELQKQHGILVERARIEQMKIHACSNGSAPETFDLEGISTTKLLPMKVTLTLAQLDAFLVTPVKQIVTLAGDVIGKATPALIGDLAQEDGNGVVVTGGGANLRGLIEALQEGTGLSNIRPAEDPLFAVARGMRICLANHQLLRAVCDREVETEGWAKEQKL